MARRPAVERGRDTAVAGETATLGGGALASSVDPWEQPEGAGRRGRSGGGSRGGGRWAGSGGRWWVWAGRAVLWALIIVILVNGVRAPFERFTADEDPAGAASGAQPRRSAGFPDSAAGAFALQFANVYLNYDQKSAADRERQLQPFLPDGTDAQFGWNGVGKMQVQSVQVAGVDARDANNGTVTLLARTADRWLRLSVPVYADKSGSLVVSGHPALLPPPVKAQLPPGDAANRDARLEKELQPFLGTFFQEYAAGNQEALSRFSDGSPIAGLADSVTFVQVKEVVAPRGADGERTVTATVVWQPAGGGGGELEQSYRLAMVKKGTTWLVRDIRGATRPDGP